LIILGLLSACTRGPLDALAHFGSGTPEHSASRLHGKNILNSYTDSYALLIGESNYSRWSSLDSVPGELQRVEEMLKSQGFQVETWLDINAAELRARFEQFISTYGLDEKNRLLFYFGGHGHTRQYQGLNKGYIVPIDAPDPNVDEKGFVRKAVSMDDIYAWAKRIEANHALFVFDSCFSGTIFKVRSDKKMPEYIRASAAEPVRQFITAGRAGETVPAQSVFTPIFIDALKDGDGDLNGDGYVTGAELGYHLASKVPDHNAQQHPQFGTIKDYELSRGDFVFVVDSGSQREQTSQSQSLSTVVPRVKPDSDRDGVNDDEDNCPENGAAELVKGVYKQGEQTGCPLDNDQDGVADYQDSCPYNQPNEIANGVNSNGCPRDTDRDGVADYRDHCPRNQRPEIIQGVSKRGCPLDLDQDGVADYQDNCPRNTSKEISQGVNSQGCPVKLCNRILSDRIFFDYNMDPLTYRARTTLDGLVSQAGGINHMEHVYIMGHASDRGTEEYNQRLSEERASSVANYLIGKGMPADKMTLRGDGEQSQIGTEEEQANHRRVDIRLVLTNQCR